MAGEHICSICDYQAINQYTPQSTEVPYLDHGEPENEPIEKVYVTTLVTPMGLFNYVDGINLKITPKK